MQETEKREYYHVECFSAEDNKWYQSSQHKNIEYAAINMKVRIKSTQGQWRIVRKGQIIGQEGKSAKTENMS